VSTGAGIAIGVGVVGVVGLVGFLVYQNQKSKPSTSQLLGGAFIDLAGKLF
jgi:hypothetical protein